MTPIDKDNRLDPRIRTRVRAVVFGRTGDLLEIPMVTVNLSRGGALCESDAPVPLGGTVNLRLDLETGAGAPQPVVLEAIVLRVEGRGPFQVALHFSAVPAAAAGILRAYLERLLRASAP